MKFGELLRRRLEGIMPVPAGVAEALEAHYELMLRWNRRLNLTTVTELGAAVERHYAESLFLAARVEGGTVCDVGSGAGFPGFPLAVFRPSLKVTLVESDQRKAAFLREASDLAANVRVACVRGAELRERVDWVVGRAVRVEDLMEPAVRLASRVAFLVGVAEKDALVGDGRLRGVSVEQLPWGEARWLVVGDVSRETSVE
jgi:16S rRNA (guanine(527)-N(7))-methyltransferase RsmG